MSGGDPGGDRLMNAIESVLIRMHRRSPDLALIEKIRDHYPDPVFFVESNSYVLKRFGLPRLDAFYFTMIPELARMKHRGGYGKRPRLNTLSKMAEYLRGLYIGVHVECFYVVMLDARGYMIRTLLMQKGTTDSAPFYLKEMLSIIVQHEAKAIVLCHNHPRGTLQPSPEDVQCTLRALSATMAVNIPMLDHIIIANNRAVSMRDCGVVPTKLWTMQQPQSKLLRDWIDIDLLEDSNS